MTLGLEQIKSIAFGAAYIDEKEGRIALHRFTEEQEQLYQTVREDFYIKSFATAGISLEFLTDSRNLEILCHLVPGSSQPFFSISVLVDGNNCDELKMKFESQNNKSGYVGKKFKLGNTNDQKLIAIYLPWSFAAQICKIELDDGAYVKPIEKQRKMICFGDSITHGYSAHSTHESYATRLSRKLDADARNKGIGGEIFRPELAAIKDDNFEPDIITVAYGTNDWCAMESYEAMQQKCEEFYATLTQNYPNAKIFALSPIWRIDFENTTKVGKFENAKEIIQNAVKNLDNVVFVDAYDFVPHTADLLDDKYVHPNDKGFEHYADALYDVIKKHI